LKSSLVALQKQIKRERTVVFFFGESQFGNRFAIIQGKTHRWISWNLILFFPQYFTSAILLGALH
jgi:hypothetical protein